MLGSENQYAPCALAPVETLCAALFDHPVHIVVLSELAAEETFGEISIFTTDPGVEVVDPSIAVDQTMESD